MAALTIEQFILSNLSFQKRKLIGLILVNFSEKEVSDFIESYSDGWNGDNGKIARTMSMIEYSLSSL